MKLPDNIINSIGIGWKSLKKKYSRSKSNVGMSVHKPTMPICSKRILLSIKQKSWLQDVLVNPDFSLQNPSLMASKWRLTLNRILVDGYYRDEDRGLINEIRKKWCVYLRKRKKSIIAKEWMSTDTISGNPERNYLNPKPMHETLKKI